MEDLVGDLGGALEIPGNDGAAGRVRLEASVLLRTRSLPGGRGCPGSAGWWPCSFSPPARVGTVTVGAPGVQGQGQGCGAPSTCGRQGLGGQCVEDAPTPRMSSQAWGRGPPEGDLQGLLPLAGHVCLPRALLSDTPTTLPPCGCPPCPHPPHTNCGHGPREGRRCPGLMTGPQGAAGANEGELREGRHTWPRAHKGTIM